MAVFDIRLFREEDRAAIIEGENKNRPAHHQSSVAEGEQYDAQSPPGEVRIRLCMGEPAWAYLDAVDRSTSSRRKPGVVGFHLWIAPEHWEPEAVDALYAKAIEFARSHDAKRLTTYLTLYIPDDPLVPFLLQKGFAEVDRIVPVMLDLTAFDRARFPSPTPENIRFFSYAKVGDTDENRHRLHLLALALDRDAPTNDIRAEPLPFEEFVKSFGRREWDSNAVILAANDGGEWVGATQLRFQEGTNIGWTFLTVVLPQYRGQGIALALKLHAIDAAIARNCPLILTENHEDNAPMRAINHKLGFVPDAPGIHYSKDIQEPEKET